MDIARNVIHANESQTANDFTQGVKGWTRANDL